MYIHNVPSVFTNHAPLVNYIDELIEFGYESTEKLSQYHKDELIALIMDSLDDEQSYVIFDTDDFNSNCNHIKKFFRSSSLNDAYKFAKSLKLSAYNKYRDYIDTIMEELLSKRSAA